MHQFFKRKNRLTDSCQYANNFILLAENKSKHVHIIMCLKQAYDSQIGYPIGLWTFWCKSIAIKRCTNTRDTKRKKQISLKKN